MGRRITSGQQVVRLDAGALPGHARQDPFRFQAARCLAPPDAVVRLLEVAFLAKIQTASTNRPAVAKASSVACKRLKRLVPWGSTLHHSTLLHVGCHAGEIRRYCRLTNNRQSIENTRDSDSRFRETSPEQLNFCDNAENSRSATGKGIL
jgi:hypothetical protein